MLQADKSVRVIAKAMGKTRDCIRKKIARLGLVVDEEKKTFRLLLLLSCLRSCRALRRRLSFLLPSQDSAVQSLVFLWGRKHEGEALES